MLPSKQNSCKIQARKGARCAHEREEGMNQAWLHPFWRVSLYSKKCPEAPSSSRCTHLPAWRLTLDAHHRLKVQSWNCFQTSARLFSKVRKSPSRSLSLLLASAFVVLVLLLARNDLSKHHYTIPVHESYTREALAILERVAHERLLRLEGCLRHFI